MKEWMVLLIIVSVSVHQRPHLASGISLYVSDDPQGSNEVLGPDAPEFPDQDGALVYD